MEFRKFYANSYYTGSCESLLVQATKLVLKTNNWPSKGNLEEENVLLPSYYLLSVTVIKAYDVISRPDVVLVNL